jgi:hypothetical protein
MTTSSSSAERVFSDARPGIVLPQRGRGLLIARRPGIPGPVGALPGVVDERAGSTVAFVPHEGCLATAAMAATRMAGTVAVALHTGDTTDGTFLALTFAVHLHTRRGHDPRPVRPCATTAVTPQLVGGVVRLPHLTVIERDSTLTDTVIWEVMEARRAHDWLGADLPDQAFFEDHLPELLTLRRRIRAGTLPASPAGVELARLLTDRYLSLRLVYQHPTLFRALLDEERARSLPAGGRGDVPCRAPTP